MCRAGDAYVKHNGLLSQWRGYGVDGGYSIVFEETDFKSRIKGVSAAIEDVYYHGIDPVDQPSTTYINNIEKCLIGKIKCYLKNKKADVLYHDILTLSIFYKHRGFAEEREVRVVVSPGMLNSAKTTGIGAEEKSQKLVKVFLRGGMPVPYMELFSQPDKLKDRIALPIMKVIVGPHRDAEIRVKAVKQLLIENNYNKVDVVRSEIPYIGR